MSHAAPTARVLIIGAEVLAGKVDDANGPFLIRALRARGVEVQEVRAIGDAVPTIAAAVAAMSASADYVFTTGGIGPTHDDVTVEGVAKAFDAPVIRHPDLEHMLRARFGADLNEARLKMAEVPQGARLELGDGSFVPVVWMRNVAILPGVPSLMRACFAQISDPIRGAPFITRALLLNVGEGDIAQILSDAQKARPDVAIGSYPRFDEANYRVKVTIDGRDARHVNQTFDAIQARLQPAWIVGEQ